MQRMTKKIRGRHLRYVVVSMLTLCAFPLSAAEQTLSLNRVAAYRDLDRVQKEVREECRMDEKLPAMLQDALIKQDLFSAVSLVEDPSSGAHDAGLLVSIVSLDSPPGGGWGSGQKFMKIKATLYRQGEVAGVFYRDARAEPSGSIFKNVRGNCDIVESLASQLVKHLVQWIELQWDNPRHGSIDASPIPGR
jgi:hypothetical protein